MKKVLSVCLAILACCCLALGTERRALAYVDPGSGLLILQSVGSAAAAALYFMRRRISALFGGNKGDGNKKEVSTDVAADSDRKTV
jgi:hypothetical protein